MMKVRKTSLISSLFLIVFVGLAGCQKNEVDESPSPLNYVEKSDKIMNAAIDEARVNLPYFWEEMNSPTNSKTNNFTLKVAFNTPNAGREHIWVNDVRIDAKLSEANYKGVLANQPHHIPGKNIGDEIAFSQEQISDWGFQKEGKLIGYYTTHVLIPQMSEEAASEFLALVGENP